MEANSLSYSFSERIFFFPFIIKHFFFFSYWVQNSLYFKIVFIWLIQFKGCFPFTVIIKYQVCRSVVQFITEPILYPVVCTSHASSLILPAPMVNNHFNLYICEYASILLYSLLQCTFQIPHIKYITVLILLCLTYFTQHNTLKVHPCCHKRQDIFLLYY